jgi:hypothetical protein
MEAPENWSNKKLCEALDEIDINGSTFTGRIILEAVKRCLNDYESREAYDNYIPGPDGI